MWAAGEDVANRVARLLTDSKPQDMSLLLGGSALGTAPLCATPHTSAMCTVTGNSSDAPVSKWTHYKNVAPKVTEPANTKTDWVLIPVEHSNGTGFESGCIHLTTEPLHDMDIHEVTDEKPSSCVSPHLTSEEWDGTGQRLYTAVTDYLDPHVQPQSSYVLAPAGSILKGVGTWHYTRRQRSSAHPLRNQDGRDRWRFFSAFDTLIRQGTEH